MNSDCVLSSISWRWYGITAGAPGLLGTSSNARSSGVTGNQSSDPANANAGAPRHTKSTRDFIHRMNLPPRERVLFPGSAGLNLAHTRPANRYIYTKKGQLARVA